jgi:hypothetical protein
MKRIDKLTVRAAFVAVLLGVVSLSASRVVASTLTGNV